MLFRQVASGVSECVAAEEVAESETEKKLARGEKKVPNACDSKTKIMFGFLLVHLKCV